MITASVRLVVPEKRRSQAVRALRLLRGPTRARPGCVACRILSDVDDPRVVLYVEEWGAREQLERHIRSSSYRRFLAVLEMAQEPPDVRYETISAREGLELVEALRAPADLDRSPTGGLSWAASGSTATTPSVSRSRSRTSRPTS